MNRVIAAGLTMALGHFLAGAMLAGDLSGTWQDPAVTAPQQDAAEPPQADSPEPPAADDKEEGPPSIADHTQDMERHEGFFDFYWDAKRGSVLLLIDRWDQEFLHVHSLATGLGSNPVGLDRGQLGTQEGRLGAQKVVRFQRTGPRVLLIETNQRFRALTENELERRSVAESFAQSVIWGGKIVAESDGQVLVDITSWLLSDVHGVTETLKRRDQGDFKLDADRSAVFLPRCKAFPDNTELEGLLTFASSQPGDQVRATTPSPGYVSLRQHHSFVRLPDDGYQPRRYDVRSPCNFITFADYASPLDAPLQQRWITRHRLQKKNPAAAVSEAVEPIVYYVDAGAPAEIQQALIEGASWWNAAFESAGFRNAFQVRKLPADADPLDVRYNVIQWVHRSTRGWSYGGGVIDPRTGEIIKGHVTLGSLRVRQDRLMLEGLTAAPVAAASCGLAGVAEDTTLAYLDPRAEPLDVALSRIRQLSAHEVGHTLGFVHNFAASTYGDRASVMDYPAPRIGIDEDGQLDLSDAYGVGVGAWDHVAVKFAYAQFPPGSEEGPQLAAILDQARQAGHVFLSDADARPAAAANPRANLWDNGSDPIEELDHVMLIRRLALDRLDPSQLPAETSTGDLIEYLTPLYLHHRYQLQAVGKMVGGWDYQYGYLGDSQARRRPVPPDQQLAAAAKLLACVHPSQLTLSEELTDWIGPRPYPTLRDSERLPSQSGRIFDPLASARVAAELALSELLQAPRIARLTVQADKHPQLTPAELIPRWVDQIWSQAAAGDKANEVQVGRIVREVLLDQLLELVDEPGQAASVRGAALAGIYRLRVLTGGGRSSAEAAFQLMLQRRIDQVLERPASPVLPPRSLTVPPGSPIGGR